MGSTGIIWGGYAGSNNQRCGINVRWDDYDTNTPSINVYIDYYTEAMYSTADDQVLMIGGSGVPTEGVPFRMSQGTHHIATRVVHGQGQNYGGGPGYSWSCHITGHYQNVQPGVGVDWALPPRPANVPGLPVIVGVDSITSSSARVVIGAADSRGAGIDAYLTRCQRASDGALHADQYHGTTIFSGLQKATQYVVHSMAHNALGWGGWAGPVYFTTSPTAPEVPSAPSAASVTTGLQVSWNSPGDGGSPITGYDVQVATDGAFTQNVVTAAFYGGSTNTGHIPNLLPGRVYFARFRAVNIYGPGAWSSPSTARTLSSVKIKVGGTWRDTQSWVKVNGAWRQVTAIYKKVDGVWRL